MKQGNTKPIPIFGLDSEDDLFMPDKSENKDKNSNPSDKNQFRTKSELIPDTINPEESYRFSLNNQ